jgi:hypothetical protein
MARTKDQRRPEHGTILESQGQSQLQQRWVHPQRKTTAGSLRTYLERLLAMHQQTEKMEARARKSIWWLFMNCDIKNIGKTCLPCQEKLPSQASEPEHAHEEAYYPFHSLHMDLCVYEGRQFLIVIDQFSSFPHILECGKHA